MMQRRTASFVRPADTTQYAAGDLVANSTTAGSVSPLRVRLGGRMPGVVRAASLYHTDQDSVNSAFRLWLLDTAPVVTNGDNGALAGIDASTVLGTVDITADKNCGDTFGQAESVMIGVPDEFWVLVEATAAYTPGSGETFGVAFMVET